MLLAKAACLCNGGAAFFLAHFPAANAVLDTPASSVDGSGAAVERAEVKCTMFAAKPSSYSVGGARHCLAVVFRALPSHRSGVVDVRVRCADP